MFQPESPSRSALRIAFLYLLVGAGLVLLTEWSIDMWFPWVDEIEGIQAAKGLVFVVVSTGLLFLLVGRELARSTEREAHLRAVTEQSLAGLYVIQEQRFVFMNRRLAEIFGFRAEELIGEEVIRVVAESDRDRVGENVRRRIEGEIDELRYRLTGVKKSGEPIRVEVHGRVALWEGREAIVGILLDVTAEEKRREQEARTDRLEVLGQLTGAVAHDFKNLLTAIMAPLEMARELLQDDDPAQKEVREAYLGAARAAELTKKLLALGASSGGSRVPVDAGVLVRQSEAMYRRLLTPDHQLELLLDADLPAVAVDPSAMEQALLNLVVNAVHAVGDRGTIRISTYRGQDEEGKLRVVVEVSDDGSGMDARTRARIFEPFFTTKKDGTGLGLSTVQRFAFEAEGSVELQSEVGKGTTFKILLPPTTERPGPASEERIGMVREREDGPLPLVGTVLVVEDEEAVRSIAIRVLERHGFDVLGAASGREGIARARTHGGEISLLLTDLGLPDMIGTDVAREILEIRPEIAVVFMSGRSSVDADDALPTDRHFLEKPFTLAGLLGIVRRALGEEDDGAESTGG